MKRKVKLAIGFILMFLCVVPVFVNALEIEPPEPPGAIDITIEEMSYFVKGYMKHGLTFDLDADYYGNVNVEATFTHFRSGRVFNFDFEDELNGDTYTFCDMKKMPAGLYHIVIHLTSSGGIV